MVAQKCFPGEPAIPLFASKWGGEFTLDIERLRRVDRARQEIVHGAELQRKSEDFEDDLEYCELTVTYLIKIIGIRFALAIGDGAYPPDECKLTVMCGPSTPPRAQFR